MVLHRYYTYSLIRTYWGNHPIAGVVSAMVGLLSD